MHLLLAGLMAISVPLVVQVLLGLGIGFVTYTGANFAISSGESFIQAQVGGLPADMVSIINLAGFDVGVNIIFAAFSSHIAIKVAMGSFTRLKLPGGT